METILTTLLGGVVFGLALAAPPGPMNAIIAEESVLRGWTAGFSAGLGAMLADALFLVGTLVGVVAVIDRYPALRPSLYLVGGLLMVYFAIGAFREASSESGFLEDESAVKDSRGFRKTFALSVTNPYQIGFWLTVGVGLLQSGTLDVLAHVPGVGAALAGTFVVQTGSAALLVGLFVGIGAWIVSFPAALVAVGERVDRFAPLVSALSGIVLVGFGIVFLFAGTVGLVG